MMRWIEKRRPKPVPAAAFAKLLEGAAGRAGQGLQWHLNRGHMHLRAGEFAAAAGAYEHAAQLDPAGFRGWADLAAAYTAQGRNDAALDACDRAAQQTPDIACARARALRKLDRHTEARAALRAALTQNGAEQALEMLLRILAADPGGRELLEVCDGLAPAYAATALARAYRAIGLSRAGRDTEACAIMDSERYVSRVPFVPPAGLGSIDDFNRALAEDILADPSPFAVARDNLELNWAPSNSPRFAALYDFMRGEMLRYLEDMPARGLAAIMPPPPERAMFYPFNVVLRKDGSNGEHIHGLADISAVYHVVVPESVTTANDTRGALAIGCCTTHTGGYAPVWGVRYLKPMAGWLTIFPSHFFHDVVPSRTDSPRISVAADLVPLREQNSEGSA